MKVSRDKITAKVAITYLWVRLTYITIATLFRAVQDSIHTIYYTPMENT